MTEHNDQGREVWFQRVMWAYVPAHWKGFVYPSAIVMVVVPLCFLADRYNSNLSFIPLLIGWAFVMWLAARHSP